MRYDISDGYNNYNDTSLARKIAIPSAPPLEEPQIKKQAVAQENSLLGQRILLLVITVAIFAFTMVARSHVMLNAGNDLVGLRKQEASLIRQNDLLRLDVNRLKSPERINTIAKNVLGMTIAKQNIYINKEAKN